MDVPPRTRPLLRRPLSPSPNLQRAPLPRESVTSGKQIQSRRLSKLSEPAQLSEPQQCASRGQIMKPTHPPPHIRFSESCLDTVIRIVERNVSVPMPVPYPVTRTEETAATIR